MGAANVSIRNEIRSFGMSYPNLYHQVMTLGEERDSRLGKMREIIGWSMTCARPEMCLVDRTGFSLAFANTESLLILSGRHEPDLLAMHAPKAAELITPETAYGPRAWPQLERVEAELRRDPSSRRAVVHVARDNDLAATFDGAQNKMRAGEMPCTLSWQFLVRDGELHMIATMRSSDLVWGMSYDVPSFVSVQIALASVLGLELGTYVHQSGSMHVYERHFDLRTAPSGMLLASPMDYTFKTMSEVKAFCSEQVDKMLERLVRA